jgi:hypothetical protein
MISQPLTIWYGMRRSICEWPRRPGPIIVPATLARTMGEKTWRRNSRRMISSAKMAPVMGALNEAAMPAPAPEASSTASSRWVKPSVRPTAEPKAAPP